MGGGKEKYTSFKRLDQAFNDEENLGFDELVEYVEGCHEAKLEGWWILQTNFADFLHVKMFFLRLQYSN